MTVSVSRARVRLTVQTIFARTHIVYNTVDHWVANVFQQVPSLQLYGDRHLIILDHYVRDLRVTLSVHVLYF